jgi:hypothetical protein
MEKSQISKQQGIADIFSIFYQVTSIFMKSILNNFCSMINSLQSCFKLLSPEIILKRTFEQTSKITPMSTMVQAIKRNSNRPNDLHKHGSKFTPKHNWTNLEHTQGHQIANGQGHHISRQNDTFHIWMEMHFKLSCNMMLMQYEMQCKRWL